MTEAVVLLPAALSWWVAWKQSLGEAFLKVYLPVILILPDYYTLPVPGAPDPSFLSATILPLGAILCWKAFVKKEWKYSVVDFAVASFLIWQIVCEVYNTGYEKLPDLIFDLFTLAIWPYMGAKTLIEQTGRRVAFARKVVWSVFLVCVISIYEFKMGLSLFRLGLGPLFPGQTPAWVTQLRWGFGRIAGPYGHAITMAVFIGVAYLFHRWLCQIGAWERKFRFMGSHPFQKQQILTAGLLAGLFMTLSRGPWLGAIAGGVLASIGLRKQRGRALIRALLILVVGGSIVYYGGKEYLNGVSAFEGVEEQASAAYRVILVGQYEDIVMQSPIFGWGRANWPLVTGMLSIDNNYLFVALGTGLVGLGLFALMFMTSIGRIFSSGFFPLKLSPEDRTFRFTLLGILISIAISTGTTYIGMHMYPLFFSLLGWSEACAMRQTEAVAATAPREVPEPYQMMKVIA